MISFWRGTQNSVDARRQEGSKGIYKSRLEPLTASAALGVIRSTALCTTRSSHNSDRVLHFI